MLVIAGALLAISPDAREAVAERLGLRGAQLTQTQRTTATHARLNLGQPLTLDQVRARVRYNVALPTALGNPDETYLLDDPPGGQVALVYYPRPDLPQANSTGVGVLLTEFQANIHSTGVIAKGLPPGTRLEEVQVNRGRGFWMDGDPHTFFYVDARGQVETETTRLAANVLLWEQGDLTLRLESALPKDAALNIAVTVH
jgi:hypothetical protein